MKRQLIYLASIALSLIFLISCTKENVKDDLPIADKSSSMVEDEIELEDLLEDLFFEIEDIDYLLDGFKDGRDGIDCKTVTIEPEERGVFPKIITIDFGDGCEIKEGVVKKGKIVVELSAAHNAERWTKKISFDGYAVNNKEFKGGKRISFIREGRRNMPSWQINSRMRIQWGEDSFVQHTSERTRVQTQGFDTPRRPMDDTYIIIGSGTGVNRKGLGYKKEITEPLHVSRDCKWIKKGVISLKVRGKSEMILNYGDGTCDNLATVTKDGETKEIKLKKK